MKRLLLILFLFSTILPAMEPAVIQDVNGQLLELTQAQRNALGQCKTLRQMLGDCGSQTIDFEGISAPIIKDNVVHLASLIEDSKKLSEVPREKILPLFQLADYLHAPKEICMSLAEKVEKSIELRISQLEELVDKKQALNGAQSAEYADLQVLWQSLQKNFGRMSKWVKVQNRNSIPEGLDIVRLNHSQYHPNNKKLRSLRGVEGIGNTELVGALELDGHNISSIDLALLRKIFPNLRELSLQNNRIENIVETEPISNLKINLYGNPLKSIVFENPERCDSLKLSSTGKAEVIFKQTNASKIKCWVKALGVQGGIFSLVFLREVFDGEESFLSFCGGILYSLHVSDSFISFLGNTTIVLKSREYAIPVALLGLSMGPKYATIACMLLNIYKTLPKFHQEMERIAYHYPYRIQIESQFGVCSGFPSNYTYNLFGKF